MNNAEAKEILDHNWTKLVNPDYSDEELGEAQNLAIKALEQTEWIPVTERLPDEHQGCLFWDEDLGLGYGGYFTTSRGIGCFWDDTCGSDAKNVIAWMPLPEPYKEKEK